MLQTIFNIPDRLFGIPMFGFGLLLAVWAVSSAAFLGWTAWRRGLAHPETRSYLPLLLLLGGIIWLVLPKIAEPGVGLPIRGYGVMLLLGVLAGTALSVWRGYRRGLDPDKVLTLVFWVFVPGILGARAFYVIQYWQQEFHRETLRETLGTVLNITQGGVVVYGALIGAAVGAAAFAIKEKWPLLATLDLLAPGMLLGASLGRVGCFLNGCCYGGVCELPWAVEFPAGSPPYMRQVETGEVTLPTPEQVARGELFVNGLKVLGPAGDPAVVTEVEPDSPAARRGVTSGQEITSINGVRVATVEQAQHALVHAYRFGPWMTMTTAEHPEIFRWPLTGPPAHTAHVHPTQLYSAIDALVLCLFLLAYDPFRRRNGELVALLLTLYPINRILMEIIRTDEPKVWITDLTIGQVVSVLLLVLATGLWIFILRKPADRSASPQAAT